MHLAQANIRIQNEVLPADSLDINFFSLLLISLLLNWTTACINPPFTKDNTIPKADLGNIPFPLWFGVFAARLILYFRHFPFHLC